MNSKLIVRMQNANLTVVMVILSSIDGKPQVLLYTAVLFCTLQSDNLTLYQHGSDISVDKR